MRIAILTHSYPNNCDERQYAANAVFSFAQILADKVEKVFVFAPDYGGKKEKYQKVPAFWLPWSGGKKKFGYLKPWRPKDVFQLIGFLKTGGDLITEYFKKEKIDFCFVIWTFPSGPFALKAKKELGVPYAVWALGSDLYVYPRYPVIKQIIQKILKNADLRFGHGEYMTDIMKELSGAPCHFLPYLSTLSFKKQKKVKLNQKKFNFLFLGRLEKIKGVELLLEAIISLYRQNKNFNLYLIGDGRLEEPLKKRVAEEGLENNVFFLGRIDDRELLAGYFLNTDALIIPSRVECLPLVFTEAMKAKLPMIATNIGDMGRLIRKHRLGLVFSRENKLSLVRALRGALKEGKNFKRHRQQRLSKIGAEFTLEAVVDQFLEKVKEVKK